MATMSATMTTASTGKGNKAAKSDVNMWSKLLDDVGSGKRLPEKRIILLGGSPATQKDLLDVLESKSSKNSIDRQKQRPAIANDFALGYTYTEVMDTDQEDILARLSIYTLQGSSQGFSELLQPLLTSTTIPETLLVIVLDWSEPWNWITQIRDWIRLLHATMSTLDEVVKQTMQEVMQDWEQQRRGGAYDMGLANAPPEAGVTIPLGPGEWDEPLGLPLCVVCHNADQIDVLEREHGWREEDFDYVLQFVRTILLKHGGSLVYTSNSMPNFAPLLIQYSLGIKSTLKRETLKHNVVDRDKILIPPNWDSWGKIKVLGESFDVEKTSENWSLEIQPPPAGTESAKDQEVGELFKTWTEAIKDPTASTNAFSTEGNSQDAETKTINMQEFLSRQTETLERLKAEEEDAAAKGATKGGSEVNTDSAVDESSRVREHIGPIQTNVAGITMDAEAMIHHIKERGNTRSTSPEKNVFHSVTPEPVKQPQKGPEELANFFASLIKKSGGSAAGTPPRASRGS